MYERNMEYTTILTAAGHRLMMSPRKQRSMYRDILDAVLAEARVGKRCLSYNRYRAKRGATGDCSDAVSITFSLRRQLERLDDQAFQRIDAGIVRSKKRPKAASTKPKYYRWFIGDLRRVLVDEFPILYSFDEERGRLAILFFGLSRRKRAAKPVQGDSKPLR
jgi:mRNA-degrading endonuclease RelE of RelBE toxin-antitoxin system